MASALEDLLGDSLLLPDGTTVPTASHLASCPHLAIYFSAHWCPPCRGFTPKLGEFHAALKARHPDAEVVFCSSDKDAAAFDEYRQEMPFPAVPFERRDVKDALSKRFKVQGIPTLVVVDRDGKLVTKEARAKVMEDPKAESFPWTPPTFEEALGTEFVNNKGDVTTLDQLKDKVLGLYFSAHWCPPCRGFTPALVKTYEKVVADGKNLEMIFVSSDRDEGAFKEYHSEMPWLALPYADRKRKGQLSDHFGVEGIPTLVFVHPDGRVINSEGRSAVSSDPEGNEFPWYPKPVGSLSSPDGINETPSLVVLMEKADAKDQERITEQLSAVAKPFLDEALEKGADREMLFFTNTETGGVGERVRALVGMKEVKDTPQVVLIDIPDSGAFFVFEGEPDEAGFREFLELYKKRQAASPSDKDDVLKRNQLQS